MKFGFLINKQKVTGDGFAIAPLEEIDAIIETFYNTTSVSHGWIYGPERELTKSHTEKKKFSTRAPITCSSYYSMPPTHQVTTSCDDVELSRFLILGYGFLNGIYLSPEGNLYLDRVPYECGKLTGLVLVGKDRQLGMQQIASFYRGASPQDRKLAFSILHWFLLGQTHRYPWEKFDSQYKVLDGVFRLSKLKSSSHAERPVVLAKEFGVTLPSWAKLITPRSSRLSDIRNELAHEARFDGEPIGYAHPKENFGVEFSSFNIKLICGVLGIKSEYLREKPGCIEYCAWNIAI
ncbi:hypothetical protein AB6C58_20375 [Vibrio splendidus]